MSFIQEQPLAFIEHPLIQRLLLESDYLLLNTHQDLDQLAAASEFQVLLFGEQPHRFPETLDIAVILPELLEGLRAQGVDIRGAVVSTEIEKVWQKRYGFREWPTLVFLKQGRYLGKISRIQNWDDYLRQIPVILAETPAADPGGDIPLANLSG